MTIDRPSARTFNQRQLDAGKLTIDHITELVGFWQKTHGLDVDGKAGSGQTIPSIDAAITLSGTDTTFPARRCYPLRALPDGRKPVVTSSWKGKNPERPTHNGCDLFYAYFVGKDPVMKTGDGGRTPRWWIPDNTTAIAAAEGKVVLAGSSPTGFRVWVDVGGGWHVGYFHLTRLLCHVGDQIALGAPVGIVGDNPIDNDARHLHFETYFGELGDYPQGVRDPEKFLSGDVAILAAE